MGISRTRVFPAVIAGGGTFTPSPTPTPSFERLTNNKFSGNPVALETGWSLGGVTLVTDPLVAAPDGSLTARRIQPTTGTGGHNIETPFTKLASGRGYARLQAYFDKGTPFTQLGLSLGNSTADRFAGNFSPATGLRNGASGVGSATATHRGGNAFIRDVGTHYQIVVDGLYEPTAGTISGRLALANGTLDSTQRISPVWVEAQDITSFMPSTAKLGAPRIIVSTDLFTDPDDIVGLRNICGAHLLGDCVLLAVVVDGKSQSSAPAVRAMLDYAGLSSVPVGATMGAGPESPLAQPVRNAFRPGDVKENYTEAVTLARQVLAANADNSVTWVGIGGFNVAASVLRSVADGASALGGMALVTAKVRRAVMMGGRSTSGGEYNAQIAPADTAYVCANWPTEILGVPFDGPDLIATGMPIGSNATTDPFAMAFVASPTSSYYANKTGVTSVAITAGSGGTSGTYPITATGGTGTGFAGFVTVAGGAITAVKITAPGEYSAAPALSVTVPGLTGAALTPTLGTWSARISSWDPVAVHVGIYGMDAAYWAFLGNGENVVDPVTGNNVLTPQNNKAGRYTYGTHTAAPALMASLMMQPGARVS